MKQLIAIAALLLATQAQVTITASKEVY